MDAVEAQDIGGERTQTRKDARIAADPAGVLGEATVTDVVGAILDMPMVTNGFGALSGRQHDVAGYHHRGQSHATAQMLGANLIYYVGFRDHAGKRAFGITCDYQIDPG